MTPEALALLHAEAFTDAPRPWTAAEFAELLSAPANHLLAADRGLGFLLARIAGPEAEILTLCVAPRARRQGIARALLADLDALARREGVEELFLDVAEDNDAARALYAASGYRPAGFRKNYYSLQGKRAISALVLQKALS